MVFVGRDVVLNQERNVVPLAVAGASNRAIADQMFLSPRTVETHLGSAYRKLGVRNRRELLVWASEGPGLDVLTVRTAVAAPTAHPTLRP